MGTTPKRGLRYPDPTVLANTLHTRIQELALDTETALDYTALGGFQQMQNLCAFQESNGGLAGYIVIQTNQLFTNVMTRIHVTGHTYEPNDNVIDFEFTYYPFSGSGTFHNYDFVNKGSYHPGYVGLWTRNSDGKAAIVIGAPSEKAFQFNFPRFVVDGHFGHSYMDPTTYTSGWSVSRVADLSAYTRKIDLNSDFGSADNTGWTAISLPAGVTNYSPGVGGFAKAAYCRQAGIVYFTGLIVVAAPAGAGTVIATLPNGFRPQNTGAKIFSGMAGTTSGNARIDMNVDGTLVWQQGVVPWFSLEQISYPAAA